MFCSDGDPASGSAVTGSPDAVVTARRLATVNCVTGSIVPGGLRRGRRFYLEEGFAEAAEGHLTEDDVAGVGEAVEEGAAPRLPLRDVDDDGPGHGVDALEGGHALHPLQRPRARR